MKKKKTKKNPALDLGGTAVASGVGLTMGAAQFALDGTNLTRQQQGLAMLGVGGLGGLAAAMVSPAAGKAMAGAGMALGGYLLLSHLMTRSAAKKGGEGETTTKGLYQAGREYMGMGAVQAELGAVEADLGAVQAELGAAGAYDGGRMYEAEFEPMY